MRNIAKHVAIAFLFALLASLATSCADNDASDDTPLALVPADASAVAVVDLHKCLIEAGCSSRHSHITLTDDLKLLLSSHGAERLFAVLAENGDKCQLDRFTIFTDSLSGANIAIVPLSGDEPPSFSSLGDSQSIDTQNLGEIRCYRCDNFYLFVGQHNIILMHNDMRSNISNRLAEVADNAVARARKLSIAQLPFSNTVLQDSTQIARLFMRIDLIQNPLGESATQLLATARLTQSTIETDARFYDSTFSRVNPLKNLDVLDPQAFSPYIPANTATIAAFRANSTTFANIVSLASNHIASLTKRLAFQALAATLQPIDGTFAIAAAPGGNRETISRPGIDTWQYCMVVPMPEGENPRTRIDNIVNAVRSFRPNVRTVTTADGLCLSGIGYGKFYIANMPGALTVSNYSITRADFAWREAPYGCTYFNTSARDAVAFAAINVPYRSELMYATKLRAGLDGHASMTPDGQFSASLSVKGGDLNFMQFLIKTLTTL